MRFLTLNLRHGGGNRVAAIVAWLEVRRPDVVVLTEYRANAAGERLRRSLESLGFAIAAASKGPAGNGVLIASRMLIRGFERVTPEGALHGELLLAEISDIAVLGCYFPGGKAKAPYFDRCSALARTLSRSLIALGDFNTGCNLRDLAPRAARFECSEMFLDLERKAGLIDLWRAMHGEDAREWTWLSRVANGYRLDHAFANAAFLKRMEGIEVDYLHDTRTSGLSDHSAMFVAAAEGRGCLAA